MKHFHSLLSEKRVRVENFLEIGSRDGLSAQMFASLSGIKNVHIIEPAPESAVKIRRAFPEYNVYQMALSNFDGESFFHNVVEENEIHRGMSSLLDRDRVYDEFKTDTIRVRTVRGDTFLRDISVDRFDAVKIDVEGAAYEVLEGFGDSLSKLKALHVEAEVVPVWKNQKLYSDVKALLEKAGFGLFYYFEYNHPTTQCDTIWMHESLFPSQTIFQA